jgi:hypothetical protein
LASTIFSYLVSTFFGTLCFVSRPAEATRFEPSIGVHSWSAGAVFTVASSASMVATTTRKRPTPTDLKRLPPAH